MKIQSDLAVTTFVLFTGKNMGYFVPEPLDVDCFRHFATMFADKERMAAFGVQNIP